MQGMSEIVKNIVKVFCGFILLFGVYIILYGHLTPGGGFSGGVIITGLFILLCLAYGKEFVLQKLSLNMSAVLDSLGAVIFLAFALLGIIGGYFFLNILPKGRFFELFSGGIILPCNIAIGLKVGISLFAAFIASAMIRIFLRKDGERDYIEGEK